MKKVTPTAWLLIALTLALLVDAWLLDRTAQGRISFLRERSLLPHALLYVPAAVLILRRKVVRFIGKLRLFVTAVKFLNRQPLINQNTQTN
jgi:hypothetical protein